MDTRDKNPEAAPAPAPASAVPKKLIPYGGYYTSKIPGHDPELTEVGPGTPGTTLRARCAK